MSDFKYIYGPVESWRLGKSLGIDPLSDKIKICNLDCLYCQLGKTHRLSTERRVFIPTPAIIEEIRLFFDQDRGPDPATNKNINFITFSGRGEPTLAKNLGEMIRALRAVRNERIAVITNATLLHVGEVQDDLALSDMVVAKLDACDEESFTTVDRAGGKTRFKDILRGLKNFRASYHGKLAIRIMFIEQNRAWASRIAEIVQAIHPEEVQINTPLRPSACRPLTKENLERLKSHFRGIPAVSVYDQSLRTTIPLDDRQTIRRHGNFNIIF